MPAKKSPPRKKSRKPADRSKRSTVKSDVIEVRGARQNNLKGLDLDIPLGKLTVVTGPSGSGKSSFAFQTLYAEGQRRYVETFSPYTRQFFDRMDKPQVDAIRGIPPAIAIEQSNNVKTTRSTVGTITEINDYLKLLFPRLCRGYDPETGVEIEPDTPQSILRKAKEHFGADTPLLVTFSIAVPPNTDIAEFFAFVQSQGYLRLLIFGDIYRADDPEAYPRKTLPAQVDVIQDRIAPSKGTRFSEAVERALDLGKNHVQLVNANDTASADSRRQFSRGWHSPDTGIELRPPTPSLFSFNHPLGACPTCKGFGRVIGIDVNRALPDKSLSIANGVVKAFQGDTYYECQQDLEKAAKREGISRVKPFDELDEEDQRWVIEGDSDWDDPEEAWQNGAWYGVRGFFKWQESRVYKMHVRVFLSRYRSYTECDDCGGTRLQADALNFKVDGKTLPELWHLSVDRLLEFWEDQHVPENDSTGQMIHGEVCNRLRYLQRVGLGYLDLNRPTRTLSGGETERVNLTTCLGASLTNTLFVLDEPTVGLHPRDTGRLVEIMHQLRDRGNTLVVVEHEESVMRSADHLVDIGPGRGEHGGELVYEGPFTEDEKKARGSLTLDYLNQRKEIPVPKSRRKPTEWLTIKRATANNLKKIDAKIPLGVFCAVSGVSGSGKSTLIHSVLFENATRHFGRTSDNQPGECRSVDGLDQLTDVLLVDQSPLARTPRSTPAVYTGIFEPIRKLFTETPDAKARALTPGYFSFNSGAGRCERCWGNGYEKVEMQFLSDLFVTCPECEGKRYTPDALEITLAEKTIHDVLMMTVSEAIRFFESIDDRKSKKIVNGLQLLAEVGMTYLRLGQPLNTLSGGESQRLKLVGHLIEQSSGKKDEAAKAGALLIFDEPTTGLHFDDVAMLLKVFDRLVNTGNSILVIEHNLDVIKSADYVIDLGPEAGEFGGEIVAEGTPEKVAKVKGSHTARFLAEQFAFGKIVPLTAPTRDSKLLAAEDRQITAKGETGIIAIHGARENNLKNFSLEIPRDQFVVVTGLSGSGKSSLAFDILFAEGQRRFLDSMSTYARQFVEQMERPDIDHIAGLPPTVAIEQRISRGGGKSTVATVTEVYHFLRLLYAKVGVQHSPDTGKPVEKQSVTAIIGRIKEGVKKAGAKPVKILAPLIKARKGYHTEVAEWAGRNGFDTLFVDGQFKPVEGFQRLARFKEHNIDVVVAEVTKHTTPEELRDAVEHALRIGKRTAKFLDHKNHFHVLSTEMSDPETGRSFEELDPRFFSYNSPHGWCRSCRGYGVVEIKSVSSDEKDADSQLDAELREERRRSRKRYDEASETVICPTCTGARLNEIALHVKVKGQTIDKVTGASVVEARRLMESEFIFEDSEAIIARDILPEITQRLKFLEEVGLGYLQLDRSATTLSGGESQRIRLAAQLGSNLRGVLYVLDEPTIGLHPRDNDNLLTTLTALRDKGNSLVVVEHDDDTMSRADHIIDLGPGAGQFGGNVVFEGSLAGDVSQAAVSKLSKKFPDSPTLQAYGKKIDHPMSGARRKLPGKTTKNWLRLKGASANNLKNIDVAIPIGRLTVLSGISGSGKSSLMRGVLKPAVDAALNPKKPKVEKQWKSISNTDLIEAIYEVDQSPIGKTSRSTPATYVKVFDEIRKMFAQLPEARARGYTASRFSFNTEGGRCETCNGNGQIKLEMNFLPTSYVQCEDCHGARYNPQTLEILYNGKSIGDVMNMSIDESADFFSGHPKIKRTLGLLRETGLGYLKLGQPSPTVSGGEAQRIKLVTELTRGIGRSQNARLRQNRTPKSNLYLIEEPSIGLHLADVRRLLEVLHRLVDDGHTVVVIEHNLDIICEADYLLDIGPEAGAEGGEIVASGTPEEVAKSKESRTAPFIREILTK